MIGRKVNVKKIKKISSILMTAVFVAALCGAMITFIFTDKEDTSYYENRSLAKVPEFTWEGALDGSLFTALGTYVKDHAPAKEELLAGKTWADINVLRRPVVNDIYLGDGVLLPYFPHEEVDTSEIAEKAATVADRFYERVRLTESFGGEYYFVAMPCQYTCYADEYPDYLNNRSEYLTSAKDAFLTELTERGINTLDMGEVYESAGRPDYFTSTVDHHFGIMGAYDTYREVLSLHSKKTGETLDVLEADEFDVEYLPNKYVGSRLRKIFGLWESDEKLGVIIPKADIPYTRYNNGNLVASSVLDLPESEADDVLYTAYMGGDVAHTVIDTGRDELPTVLIYGESFTNAIETFLWHGFDEMHSLDLRYAEEGAFEALVEEVKPDIVICVRDYSVLLETEDYGH